MQVHCNACLPCLLHPVTKSHIVFLLPDRFLSSSCIPGILFSFCRNWHLNPSLFLPSLPLSLLSYIPVVDRFPSLLPVLASLLSLLVSGVLFPSLSSLSHPCSLSHELILLLTLPDFLSISFSCSVFLFFWKLVIFTSSYTWTAFCQHVVFFFFLFSPLPSSYDTVPPKWKIEPSDQSVVVGDRVTFDCSATGYPLPVIRWKISTGLSSSIIFYMFVRPTSFPFPVLKSLCMTQPLRWFRQKRAKEMTKMKKELLRLPHVFYACCCPLDAFISHSITCTSRLILLHTSIPDDEGRERDWDMSFL